MHLSLKQQFNQALIQMAVLLYQVDKKVTLTEQDALDELVNNLQWESPISVEAFKTEAIFHARKALDIGEGEALLRSLSEALCFDADKALEAACFITAVDGDRSEEERDILHLLTHKLLAKALTSQAVN